MCVCVYLSRTCFSGYVIVSLAPTLTLLPPPPPPPPPCRRYYGDSHPTEDVSLSNLRYLSSRQALQDIVSLKAHIMQQYKLTKENKWIAFGGSYSGEGGGRGENSLV